MQKFTKGHLHTFAKKLCDCLQKKHYLCSQFLKAAGYGWLKRKAMKAALAVAPSSQKGTYIVKDNMVIMADKDNEKDTMFISQDGKVLTIKEEKGKIFKLTRTK